jgi:hypothetical protein
VHREHDISESRRDTEVSILSVSSRFPRSPPPLHTHQIGQVD